MNKICTSIEQSKKLIESGVDVNTADMYYQWYSESALHVGKGSKKLNADCPSWSLSALLKILPKSIRLTQDMRNCYDNPIYKGEKYKFELKRCGFLSDEWYIQYCGGQERQYGKRYYHNAPVELHVTKRYDNIVDACVEMIEKLHELKML